jgi:TolB-like protein/Tfp pilus assembly protein PilF
MALNIFIQLVQGMAAAHEKNIIHRDIKPGNIIITDKGEAKIVDFGLAKLAGVDLTQSTSSKGTAAYMCPEQIRGGNVDDRCDIWALGVVFYEMLTGRLPYEGDYPESMMYAIVNKDPKKLSDHLSDFPELLQKVITKCLKKDPLERYERIAEMLADVDKLANFYGVVVKKLKPVKIERTSRRKAYRYITAVFIFAIILVLIDNSSFFLDRGKENSIAVLPLKYIMNDTTQQWFTDGMTDALITNLAQIKELSVISRGSSIRFKETKKTSPEIASELGAFYLVDGSVVNVNDSVLISVRLIYAPDDKYLWAQEYKREFRGVLGLHGEIAKAIAGQIKIKLTPQVEARLTETREVNPETYAMYMKGMFHLNKGTYEGIERGLNYFTQAVKIDSTEPLTHAGLSLGYSIIAHMAKPMPNALELSKEEALKALNFDDNLAEAHLALAMVRIYDEWDKIRAGKSYRRALELNPNLPLALMHYGYYLILMESSEKGIPYIQRAMELDPLSNIYPAELAWVNYLHENYDKSIELANKSLELVPDFPMALFALGAGYAGKGMYDQAIEVQKKSAELSPAWEWGLAHTYAVAGYTKEALKIAAKLEMRSDVWDTWSLAIIYAALGDVDKVFYWLEEAYKKRHPYIQWMNRNEVYLKDYYEEPRYKDLVKRLNIPK